ncbi:MAG: ABC transporter substrate-binding protein [Pseudomonadota bacterium]
MDNATSLIKTVSAEVTRIANSGKAESAALRDFRTLFNTYADVPTIARSVLGPPWRQASTSQKTAFVEAFEDYLSAKYGRQFNEYRGARITVTKASDQGNKGVLVYSVVSPKGASPFEVAWQVSDRSGSTRAINIFIEGVSMLSTERSEIKAMLEAQRGSLSGLIDELQTRS